MGEETAEKSERGKKAWMRGVAGEGIRGRMEGKQKACDRATHASH